MHSLHPYRLLGSSRRAKHRRRSGRRAPAEVARGELVMALERTIERELGVLNEIFARATGQSVEKIARDTERNHWMDAQQAVGYGLVGRVIERATEL